MTYSALSEEPLQCLVLGIGATGHFLLWSWAGTRSRLQSCCPVRAAAKNNRVKTLERAAHPQRNWVKTGAWLARGLRTAFRQVGGWNPVHNGGDQRSLLLGTAWSWPGSRQALASGWLFPMGTVFLRFFSQETDPWAVVALLHVVSIFSSVLIVKRVKLIPVS